MVALKDLTGETFGNLTVGCQLQNENGRAMWYCTCTCGGFKIIDSKALRTGKTASCGCLRLTHGLSGTHPLYRTWLSMRDRCKNPNNKHYRHYGGRGVRVCDRWNDFALFAEDVGDRPRGTSIDRVDNNGDYEPSNCCWATPFEQAQHTSRTRLISAKGKTMTLAMWARELGMDSSAILNRISKGWSEEAACTLPKQHRWSRRP